MCVFDLWEPRTNISNALVFCPDLPNPLALRTGGCNYVTQTFGAFSWALQTKKEMEEVKYYSISIPCPQWKVGGVS